MVNKEGSDPLHRTTTHNPSDRRLRRIKWYEPAGMQWALRRRYLSPPLSLRCLQHWMPNTRGPGAEVGVAQ